MVALREYSYGSTRRMNQKNRRQKERERIREEGKKEDGPP